MDMVITLILKTLKILTNSYVRIKSKSCERTRIRAYSWHMEHNLIESNDDKEKLPT